MTEDVIANTQNIEEVQSEPTVEKERSAPSQDLSWLKPRLERERRKGMEEGRELALLEARNAQKQDASQQAIPTIANQNRAVLSTEEIASFVKTQVTQELLEKNRQLEDFENQIKKQTMAQTLKKQKEEILSDAPDFEELLKNSKLNLIDNETLETFLSDGIKDNLNMAGVLYNLEKNYQKEVDEISRLYNPKEQSIKLGRLLGRIEAQKERSNSNEFIPMDRISEQGVKRSSMKWSSSNLSPREAFKEFQKRG